MCGKKTMFCFFRQNLDLNSNQDFAIWGSSGSCLQALAMTRDRCSGRSPLVSPRGSPQFARRGIPPLPPRREEGPSGAALTVPTEDAPMPPCSCTVTIVSPDMQQVSLSCKLSFRYDVVHTPSPSPVPGTSHAVDVEVCPYAELKNDQNYENVVIQCGNQSYGNTDSPSEVKYHPLINGSSTSLSLPTSSLSASPLPSPSRPQHRKASFEQREDLPPYENINLDHIAQLTKQGYTHDAVVRALGIARNDIEMACDILHEFATKK